MSGAGAYDTAERAWVSDVGETAKLGIVEDSDEDFAMFRRVFGSVASIQRWADGESAIRSFEDGFELSRLTTLIVDLNLPGMDGFELIERVRALPDGDAPTVCVLSSSTRPQDMRRAEEVGADGYLVKPADIAGLRALPAKVAEIIERR